MKDKDKISSKGKLCSILVIAFLCVIQLAILAPTFAEDTMDITPLPDEFRGTVTIGGNGAPVGTLIAAKINGIERGNITTTETGKYGGDETFDDRLIVQGTVDEAGNTITFWADGSKVNETSAFSGMGKSKVLDLTTDMSAQIAPNITSWNPVEAIVNDMEGASRTFNITINQTVNVSWLINGTQVSNETGVTEASYTNTSAAVGIWNVSVVVKNANGTDVYMWIWAVQAPSPCFIATAAYGTPLHEDIDVLRDFRDEYLMTNSIGRLFVRTYYATSPPIADIIRENEGLRIAVRDGLVKPLVAISRVLM